MSEITIRDWQPSDAERSDRSAADRARHRLKVREAIRQNIADIVAEEAIIGRNRDRIIKVPIRGVREYQFQFGQNTPQVGEGDGETVPGQVIGQDPSRPGEGRAGDSAGVDYYETEITLEELVEMLFEDLQLPDQERKILRQIEVRTRRKKLGYQRKGVPAQLSLRRSARQRVRRLQRSRHGTRLLETELEQLQTAAAAEESEGRTEQAAEYCSRIAGLEERLQKARRLDLEMQRRKESPDYRVPERARFPFRNEDLQFHRRRVDPQRESNAVVICIMDTSGSMDLMKKYLARSFFFLLHRFVSVKYEKIELVFIAHHTSAREVTEEEFFHKGESGGTQISSGYRKALEIIQERYHPSLWNVYAFHCSDGDNFESDNEAALEAALQLCKVCNLFGYGEIKPGGSGPYEGSLRKFFSEKIEEPNYHAILIRKKSDIWPSFRSLLNREGAEA